MGASFLIFILYIQKTRKNGFYVWPQFMKSDLLMISIGLNLLVVTPIRPLPATFLTSIFFCVYKYNFILLLEASTQKKFFFWLILGNRFSTEQCMIFKFNKLKVDQQIAAKADELQEIFITLQSKKMQVTQLEEMVKQMEMQQDRAQAQRTRLESRIAQLELAAKEKNQRYVKEDCAPFINLPKSPRHNLPSPLSQPTAPSTLHELRTTPRHKISEPTKPRTKTCNSVRRPRQNQSSRESLIHGYKKRAFRAYRPHCDYQSPRKSTPTIHVRRYTT